jgi:hypothetical protein
MKLDSPIEKIYATRVKFSFEYLLLIVNLLYMDVRGTFSALGKNRKLVCSFQSATKTESTNDNCRRPTGHLTCTPPPAQSKPHDERLARSAHFTRVADLSDGARAPKWRKPRGDVSRSRRATVKR